MGAQEHGPLPAGAPQGRVVDVEGVLHVPGRVIGRDVQGLEVVPVELDLRTARHLVPEAAEDGDDLLGGPGDRVAVPAREQPPPRQGHVDARALQLLLEPGVVDALPRPDEERLDLVAHPVGDLADARALLGRELPHAAQHRRDLALLAQVADPQLLERPVVGRRGDGLPGPFRQGLQVTDQVHVALGSRPGRRGPRPRSRPAGTARSRPAPCGRAPRRPCASPRPGASRSCRSGGRRR